MSLLSPLDLIIILSLALLAGVVAALVTSFGISRKLHLSHVAHERARWRNAMRLIVDRLILAAHHHDMVEIDKQVIQLALHLNPADAEDNAIVELAKHLAAPTHLVEQIQELIDRSALLLHHDWMCAQHAFSQWPFGSDKPRRVLHSKFKQTIQVAPVAKPTTSTSLASYFGMLMLSSSILFFLAAGLTEPFLDLVNIFDNTKAEKSISAWIFLAALSVIVVAVWPVVYLWFKACEKRLLDIWLSK